MAEAGTALGERAERKGGAGGEQREVLPLDLENFGIISFALSFGSEIPGPEARPEMQGGDKGENAAHVPCCGAPADATMHIAKRTEMGAP